MNYLFMFLIALTAVIMTTRMRRQRDQELLTSEVQKRGGSLVRLERVKKGSPFPDTSRGWWAWQVFWRDSDGERSAWALTTREGLGEWRD